MLRSIVCGFFGPTDKQVTVTGGRTLLRESRFLLVHRRRQAPGWGSRLLSTDVLDASPCRYMMTWALKVYYNGTWTLWEEVYGNCRKLKAFYEQQSLHPRGRWQRWASVAVGFGAGP